MNRPINSSLNKVLENRPKEVRVTKSTKVIRCFAKNYFDLIDTIE